jgi:hypothetical protein
VLLVKLRRAVRSRWLLEWCFIVLWLANACGRLWQWVSSYWPPS